MNSEKASNYRYDFTRRRTVATLFDEFTRESAIGAQQIETLRKNCAEFGVKIYNLDRIE